MRLSTDARKFQQVARDPAHVAEAPPQPRLSMTRASVRLQQRATTTKRSQRNTSFGDLQNSSVRAIKNPKPPAQLVVLHSVLSNCNTQVAEELAESIKAARPKASKSFFKRMRRSIRVALRGRSPRKQRRDANSKWRSLVRKGKKADKPIDDERMMAMLAQKMERARLDNDSADLGLFQLDMPEDSDESRAVITPTASIEDADGATVIQQPYGIVHRVSRDSQDDDDGTWGQFLDLEEEEPCSPSRSPAILIVPQLSASIDVPPPRAPLCF